MAKTVLVTGAAGFIGAALSKRLLQRGDRVVGLDNLNDYYDPALKQARLRRIEAVAPAGAWRFERMALEDESALMALFADERPQVVVNLAAQAGVRYSLENPAAYIQSNLVGFGHVLEGCRHQQPSLWTSCNWAPFFHGVRTLGSTRYGTDAVCTGNSGRRADQGVQLRADAARFHLHRRYC